MKDLTISWFITDSLRKENFLPKLKLKAQTEDMNSNQMKIKDHLAKDVFL